jgi:gliding motility-associated-like protein
MKNNIKQTTRFFIACIIFLSLCKLEAVNSVLNINHSVYKKGPHDSLMVVVPNVFSPNSDGINDTWSIIIHDYGVVLFNLQTTIYDRWGVPVFISTDIREVWLGHTSTGKICNSDSYFYVISYTNSLTNKQELLKGFIELVR